MTMKIRDDRMMRRKDAPQGVPLEQVRGTFLERFYTDAPDYVLYDCPDCGRSHFVTVDACPDAATAAQETARVDGRRAA